MKDLTLFDSVFRNLRAYALVGPLLALAACSTVQSLGEIEHGLSVENKGDSRISNVVIQYGKIMRKECIPFCHPKGSKCLPKVSPSIGSARPVFFINGNRTTV